MLTTKYLPTPKSTMPKDKSTLGLLATTEISYNPLAPGILEEYNDVNERSNSRALVKPHRASKC